MEMDLEKLKTEFGDAILDATLAQGQGVVQVQPARLIETLRALRDGSEWRFNFLMDIVAVDHLGESPRFEVIYILYSLEKKQRLRLKVRVEDGQELPTATELYKSADWAEREVYDMMGIVFRGHPHLKRILMFEGFEGHPLRKDYPVNRRQPIPSIEEIP